MLVPWWFAGYVGGQKSHTLDNLRIGVEAAGAGVVFLLNVVTDNEGSRCGTPAYQAAMLRYWREQLGMPLRYVELGNEAWNRDLDAHVAELFGPTRADAVTGSGCTLAPLDPAGAFPSFIAWVFTDGAERRALVANLTAQAVTLDPAGLAVSPPSARTMSASAIPGATQSFTSAVALPPYSVALLGAPR